MHFLVRVLGVNIQGSACASGFANLLVSLQASMSIATCTTEEGFAKCAEC